MAVKKKGKPVSSAKLKKAKPNGKSNGKKIKVPLPHISTVENIVEKAEASLGSIQTIIESVGAENIFPQGLLNIGVMLERLGAVVDATTKLFGARALAHVDAHGQFEQGRVGINVVETSKVIPKWKPEAVLLAEKLAVLEDADFNEQAFIESVKANYEPSVTRKVKLTVSE